MEKLGSGFDINIKYKDQIKTQSFAMAKGDDAICFYEKDKKDATIMVEPLKKEFTIDNSTHRFDAISKDDVIIVKGVENVGAEYNNDFLVTIDTEKGSKTYKISHNSVSIKNGRSFTPVVSFDEPLNVSLPESLPQQIASKVINMETFPAQMADMLANDYNYEIIKLPNGTSVLKSPDGKILFSDGTKISTSVATDIVKAPSGLVLRFLPSTEMKKNKENQVKKGVNISEEEAKVLSKFIGKDQDLSKIPTLSSDASYTKLRKASVASRVGKETDKEDPSYTVDNLMSDYYAPEYDTRLGIEVGNALTDLDKQDDVKYEGSDKQSETNTDTTQTPESSDTKPTDSDPKDGDSSAPSATLDNEPSSQKASSVPKGSDDGAPQDNGGFVKTKADDTPKDTDKNKDKDKDKDKSDADKKKKENDDKQRAIMDEKGFNAFHKGLRLILLVIAANFFMAALMFANPLFALIALMCVTGMAYSAFAQQTKFKFSSMFTFVKDIHDYFKAKHAIKELSLSETKKMNKLLEKQSKGLSKKKQKKLDALQSKTDRTAREEKKLNNLLRKQANPLSKREQQKLDMFTTRQQHELSYAEYKKYIKNDAPSMEKLNEYRTMAQQQEDSFRLEKAQAIAKLDKEIAYRQKYLEVGKDFLKKDILEQIKSDNQKLIHYRENLNSMPNIIEASNRNKISALEKSLLEKPTNWLDKELDIDQKSFYDIASESGIEEPALEVDTQQLKIEEDKLVDRLDKLKTKSGSKESETTEEKHEEAESEADVEKPADTGMDFDGYLNSISGSNNDKQTKNLPVIRDSDTPDLTR